MRIVFLTLLLIAAVACQGPPKTAGPPFSVAESMKMMQVEPGFRVELFTQEPNIFSPVAMDIDEDGRVWVVEDPGYPLNTEGKVGRVKLLEDLNGDGIPDKSTVFADQLTLPTGIMRWKKGVLVTDAPDLLYLEDTNGDGKADVRQKVLTGFAQTNPQHTVNNPVYGLDNWIYIAHENATTAIIFKDKFGDRGSDIRFADRQGVKPLTEKGRNIRFRPDDGRLEALSGTSQFGHAFDEWGHHFTLNNTYHSRHEVIPARYLKRNPDLPLPTAMEDISDHGMPAKVFPIVARPRIEMLTNVGEFTSACGLMFYLGGAFPDSFANSALVGEPAHNLVHRDVYQPAGSTFTARRSPEKAEFIASRDPWFRPVNFYTGPDGAIYMLDYYRLVIEHPEWMATETWKSKDLTAGTDRGRIYRILPEGKELPPAKGLKLSTASVEQLVEYLGHPNIWWRRNAQRLLMDRKAVQAAPQIAKLFQTSPSGVARVHALWTLDGLGKLDSALIEKALTDPVAGVRENAIKLAEARLPARPELLAKLYPLANDKDARVRFQLLCTLGYQTEPWIRTLRDQLMFRDLEDRWVQVAALSAGSDEAFRLFGATFGRGLTESKGTVQFFRQVAAVMGTRRKPDEMYAMLGELSRYASPATAWWRAASLDGLAQGLRGATAKQIGNTLEQPLLALYTTTDANVRRSALRVLDVTGLTGAHAWAFDTAAKNAQNREADPDLRADSIGLLALKDPAGRVKMFEGFVDPHEPEAVQVAGARALGRIPGEDTGKFLIKNWRNMTSAVRMEAADAIYRDPQRLPMVLAALKGGDIQAWTLAFRHKRQLIMNRDEAIRAQARPLLESTSGERDQIIRQYQASLDKSADASRGRHIFEQTCKKCHRLNGDGAEVGPDLATVRSQPKQVLLTEILNPSQSISQGFEAYVVETNGGTFDGVMGPQTTTTITLRREEGKQDVIARKDIKTMFVTNLSAMPGDLEKQVNPQQMADLLEYLKQPQ